MNTTGDVKHTVYATHTVKLNGKQDRIFTGTQSFMYAWSLTYRTNKWASMCFWYLQAQMLVMVSELRLRDEKQFIQSF